MNAAEAGRQVCENMAREVQQIAPPGLGRWEPAWDIVADADAEFMIALFAWEDSPSEKREALVRHWGDEVMARWREAIKKFEEAHHAK
jgi:hypothetical protein